MTTWKNQAIIWSDRLALARLTHGSPKHRLTTIVYHHFRFGDETWDDARERLRRQCDFLATNYQPLSIHDSLEIVQTGNDDVKRPLLVTIDDAQRELFEVLDLFEAFGIPLVQFVCAGWSELADSRRESEGLPIRLVARLHFYDGPKRSVRVGGKDFSLNREGNTALIDNIIQAANEDNLDALTDLEALDQDRRPRSEVCDWAELRDLQAHGVTIGCHSVSHPQIARQSPLRQRFEIVEARQFIEKRLGRCTLFAYPYGIQGSYNEGTHSLLRVQDFAAAFTSQTALAKKRHDPHLLPRIVMPDEAMSDAIFKARVQGGGIPLTRLKECFS